MANPSFTHFFFDTAMDTAAWRNGVLTRAKTAGRNKGKVALIVGAGPGLSASCARIFKEVSKWHLRPEIQINLL